MFFFFRQVSHRSFQTYHSPGLLFRCVKKHLLSKSSTLEASLYNCSTSSWKNSWCSDDNRNDVELATRREKCLTWSNASSPFVHHLHQHLEQTTTWLQVSTSLSFHVLYCKSHNTSWNYWIQFGLQNRNRFPHSQDLISTFFTIKDHFQRFLQLISPLAFFTLEPAATNSSQQRTNRTETQTKNGQLL